MVASLGACSSVPDALNPVEWYKDTVDFFSGDDDGTESAKADDKPQAEQAPPGADKPYPSLNDVPPREAAPTKEVPQGLMADTRNRRYTDETIARQGDPTNPLDRRETLTAVAQAQPASQAPSPGAMPARAVSAAPMTAAATRPAAAPMGAPKAEPMAPPSTPRAIMSRTPPAAAPAPQMAAVTPPTAPRLAGATEVPARPMLPPANALVPGAGDPFATVVVSSDGVETMGSGGYGAGPGVAAGVVPLGAAGAPLDAMAGGQTALPGGALRVATIQFGNGSAQLSEDDRAVLRQVRDLQRSRGGRLQVVGHASSRTRDLSLVRHKMVNFQVSADRADAVARELMRLGVQSADIVIGAVADADPVFYEIMPAGEAGNRRAEVYLIN
ncbi:MAG: OmpA family protein [Hyphomicrobiales bacterium]|nr:OmpA family protein [Hyphomicrobiales bacterium]